MSELILPSFVGRSWPVNRVPEFNTKTQRAASGKLYRAAFVRYPTFLFSFAYDVLRDGDDYLERQEMLAFFMNLLGPGDTFKFDDPNDNSVTAQSFGTGDGSTTEFQLVRTYGAGGFTQDIPVENVNVITAIYDDGTPVTQGAGPGKYQVSSTGVITFGTAPVSGHALTWTGTFYYRCRFTEDGLDFNNFMSGLWNLRKLEFRGSPQNKVG